MKMLQHVTFYFIIFSLLCAITTKSESAPGGFCQVGDVLSSGQSCTDGGTGDDFTVIGGRGQYGFINAATEINLKGNINGKERNFHAKKRADGNWEILSVSAGDTAPPPPVSVPNVMLRVVRVTPDWMPFASAGGWPAAVPLRESEVLKFYEVAIWEERAAVHLYAFPNDYDPHLHHRGTDAQIIAYREQFLISKYTGMPDAWTNERSVFLKSAFMDIALYLTDHHQSADHHLMYSGHGGPGGRLFGAQLNADHADAFLSFWSESLGKPLGVIDMGGPCNKAGFEDLDIFSEYARYYVASDLPNGGYTMDDWTIEKFHETKPETQYHNLFAANPNLEDVLIGRIDLKRKAYEYSRNNMISNQVAQANYLYSCDAFRRFSPNFIAFYDRVGVDYPVGADLNRYMIDNGAPQALVEQFNDIIVHKADNKDFFQWSEPRNGILMPDPEFLHQQRPEDVNTDVNGNVSASVVSPLTEATLDGSTVTLLLTGAAFEQDISRIRDAVTVTGIDGVTIDTATVQRINDRKVTIELKFDGTDLTSDTSLLFNVADGAITNHKGSTLTAEILVTANTDEALLKIYWQNAGDNKIQRANPDGSNIEDLVAYAPDTSSVGLSRGIALDVLDK